MIMKNTKISIVLTYFVQTHDYDHDHDHDRFNGRF